MTLDPFPCHLVAGLRLVQPLPQFDILDRLLVSSAPAVLLPAVNPRGDTVLHIGAVGDDGDLAGPFQRLERVDRGQQFHAVVGGIGLAAVQFAFLDDLAIAYRAHQRTPAAGAGVARTGAVRIGVKLCHGACSSVTWPGRAAMRAHQACKPGKRAMSKPPRVSAVQV